MKLSNNEISVEVSAHGAELVSLRKKGREYMWTGDAAYWNRHAPILFPAVGKPFHYEIRIDGKVYPLRVRRGGGGPPADEGRPAGELPVPLRAGGGV